MSTPPPPCPHLDRCAGCPAMGASYPEQVRAKAARFADVVGRHAELGGARVEALAPAEPALGYRTRIKWVTGPGGALGLFARGAEHEVVDTPGCLVVTPLLGAVAGRVRGALRADAGGPLSKALSAVDVREVRDEAGAARALVTLVTRGADAAGRAATRALGEVLAASEGVAGVATDAAVPGSPQLLGGRIELVAGEAEAVDHVGGARVLATHGAFVQAHRGQAARLAGWLGEAVGALGPTPRVLELYAGSGALGLALAAAGAEVSCVESFGPAAQRIERAARANGHKVRAFVADAEGFTREAARRGEAYDAVVVDPPRRGLPPRLREAIAALRPRLVAYASCRPETLARDLAHFARLGLAPQRALPLDMIPQTDEIEALVLLAPADPAPLRLAARLEDAVIFDVGPFAHEAALRDEAQRVTGWTAPVAVHAIPASASGLTLVARDGAAAEAYARDLGLEALVAAKSVLRAKGTVNRKVGPHAQARTRIERLGVSSGHSVARVRTTPASLGVTFAHLGSLGHPVLGEPRACDEPTRRYVFEKHGLDRAFAHVTALTRGETVLARSPLAPDLAHVAESLGVAAETLAPPP